MGFWGWLGIFVLIAVLITMIVMEVKNTQDLTKRLQSATDEISSLENKVKQVGSSLDSLKSSVTAEIKTFSTTQEALQQQDIKMNAQLSRLMSLGKIGEVNQIAIKALNTMTGTGQRVDKQTVLFQNRYSTPPKILLTPVHVEGVTGKDLRYELIATQITNTSFVINIGTWNDAAISEIVVQYATVIA